jgi:enoyl-CoA hydratase/carnithine racemase
MSEPRLRVERDGPIGRMVFDSPARRNAISGQMWRAIPAAMATFEADPAIRCIVLRGEGNVAFAAGADISEFEQRRSSEGAVKEYDGIVDAAQHAIEDSRKPVIALIHGFCIGGGLEMALACDLRYAGTSSQFAIPAARLGLGYGVHGTNRLVATVGHAAAREIMFTGRRYGAEEALAMGLVNRVLTDADLDEYVGKIAQDLAANAPLSIAASKTVIETLTLPKGDFTRAKELIERCMKSEDYVEGRRAFMEKRPPRFKAK